MAVLVVAACQSPAEQDEPAARQEAVHPRGTYVLRQPNPEDRTLRFGPGPQRRILYMNRFGGTYYQGDDNSSSNSTSIPTLSTSTLSPFGEGDSAWDELMSCVRQMYAPFDIMITETDPGAAPHIESVVAGLPEDIGEAPGSLLGIAAMYSDCSVVERAVVFTFPSLHNGDIEEMCGTVAQESAHALGLDHELACLDPMTYQPYCGPRSFQDQPIDCGEDTPRACACGGSTQNSAAILRQVLGEADGDAVPPVLAIVRPQDGAVVPGGFEVEGQASDSSGVDSVTMFIDGAEHATDVTEPYIFTAPYDLPAGPHTVELRATDTSGNLTPRSVTVTVEADAGDDDGSGGGGGGGGTGEGPCDPVANDCGPGYDCAPVEGGGGECVPGPAGTNLVGGCAVGPARGGRELAGLLLVALATVRIRRRRRS